MNLTRNSSVSNSRYLSENSYFGNVLAAVLIGFETDPLTRGGGVYETGSWLLLSVLYFRN